MTQKLDTFFQNASRRDEFVTSPPSSASAEALCGVLRLLRARAYRFTTTTPLTHQRVLQNRSARTGTTLADVFGWNIPFEPSALNPDIAPAMNRAQIFVPCGDLQRSSVRVASLGDDLFFHSSFPTTDEAAVFFGPDTYRFARLIRESLDAFARVPTGREGWHSLRPVRVLDVGCGTGAGGIATVRKLGSMGFATELMMSDINPLALFYAGINSAVAGVPVSLRAGDALSAVQGDFDLIICNPPYMYDAAHRAYRDGGEGMGRALSLRIAKEALSRLAPGGKLILYTGVAIIDGSDSFQDEVLPLLADTDCEWSYSEIDPDVFGEELELPAYMGVDRIAAVGLVAQRKGSIR